MESKDLVAPIVDPGEYIMNNAKYHNCHLTVGDPDSSEVETIGVSRVHLVSQSTVFREMLEDSELADPSGRNTHIKDVTPTVFKLMLRHLYGEELPEMSKETAAQLLICADKYNVKSLVRLSGELLIPTSVDELFRALKFVSFINVPSLLPHVTKFLQEQTDKVLKHPEFLQLDDNSLELIVQQESLAVSELDLWHGLVAWAKARSEDPTEQRQFLAKPMKHLRFLSFTEDEFINNVWKLEIFSSSETFQMFSAIKNNTDFQSSTICTLNKTRSKLETQYSSLKQIDCTTAPFLDIRSEKLVATTNSTVSKLSIETKGKQILLESFTFQANTSTNFENDNFVYMVSVEFMICRVNTKGYVKSYPGECLQFDGDYVVSNHNFEVEFKECGHNSPLILAPNSRYVINIYLSSCHRLFQVVDSLSNTDTTNKERQFEHFVLKFKNHFNVEKVNYRIRK